MVAQVRGTGGWSVEGAAGSSGLHLFAEAATVLARAGRGAGVQRPAGAESGSEGAIACYELIDGGPVTLAVSKAGETARGEHDEAGEHTEAVDIDTGAFRHGAGYPEPERLAYLGCGTEYVAGPCAREENDVATTFVGLVWQLCGAYHASVLNGGASRGHATMDTEARILCQHLCLDKVRLQYRSAAWQPAERFAQATKLVEEAEADIPFHVALPIACSWSAWAKNALVRLSEEMRHRMHATGTLLNEWPAPVRCAWCLSANTLS